MLRFNNVFFKYYNSNDYILKNINFQVEEGEWLTIVGNNGSGKSTITKLICAQYEQQSGEIFLYNKIYNLKNLDFIRDNIAVVFQNPDNQFVGSTVEEDIAFGLENKNISQEKMDDIITNALKTVDMTEYRFKEPRELSGGQKQRVAIASALALNPKILILDEATSMLDPLSKKNILDYIKKINKESNTTIISITHDVEELKYSDKILLLQNGEIITQSSVENIFYNIDFLEKYNLEVPFIYKLKNNLNNYFNYEVFKDEDNTEKVVEKICKLILKK